MLVANILGISSDRHQDHLLQRKRSEVFKKSILSRRLTLILSLMLASLFILQCKQDSKKASGVARIASSKASCPLNSQSIKEALGLGPIDKVNGNSLQVQKPSVVVMDYEENQKTVLLQVETDDSETNIPDYAKYKITDSKGRTCASGETGPAFFKEIYIPSACSGILNVSVQACAVHSRLNDPNVPCGPMQSAPYSHEANPTGDLGNVLALIQENERETAMVSRWLAARARAFLAATASVKNPTNMQTLEISLAELFTRNQADFYDIFLGEQYDDLQELAANPPKEESSTGLKLADETTVSESCFTASSGAQGGGDANASTPGDLSQMSDEDRAAAEAQVKADLQGAGESKMDLQEILDKAREEYGARGDVKSLVGSTSSFTDTMTEVSTIELDSQVVSMNQKSPLASILGGIILGIGVVYAAYFLVVSPLMKGYKRAKSNIRRDFLKDTYNGKLVQEVPDKVSGGTKLQDVDLKKGKVKWVGTGDASKKILKYNKQVFVAMNDGSDRFQLMDAKSGAGKLAVEKSPFLGKQKVTFSTKYAHIDINDPNFKSKRPSVSQTLKKTKMSMGAAVGHGSMVIALIGGGAALLAMGSKDGLFLASKSDDVFAKFVNDMKSVQKAVEALRKENDQLQAIKTNMVTRNLPK